MNFKSIFNTVSTIVHWIDLKMTAIFRLLLGFLAAHPDWVWRLIFLSIVIVYFLKWDKKLKAKTGGAKGTFGATMLRLLLWLAVAEVLAILILAVYLSSK